VPTSRKIGLVSLLILGCCLTFAGCGGGGETADQPGPTPEPVAQAAPAAEPETVVTIEAYYPLNEEHQYIADYLNAMEVDYAGKVRVQVWDMASSEGRKKWQESGLTCAGVFVNGKTTHEITKDGEQVKVSFLKRMDIFWDREDLELVVKQLLGEEAKENEPPS